MRKIIKKIYFIILFALILCISVLVFTALKDIISKECATILLILLVVIGSIFVVLNIVLTSYVYYWNRMRRVKGKKSNAEIKNQIGLYNANISFRNYYEEIWKHRRNKANYKVFMIDNFIERMLSKNEIKEVLIISFMMMVFLQIGLVLIFNETYFVYTILVFLISILSPYLLDLLILRTRYEESLFMEISIDGINECYWCNNKKPNFWDFMNSTSNEIACGYCNSHFAVTSFLNRKKILFIILVLVITETVGLLFIMESLKFIILISFITSWITIFVVIFLFYIFVKYKIDMSN